MELHTKKSSCGLQIGYGNIIRTKRFEFAHIFPFFDVVLVLCIVYIHCILTVQEVPLLSVYKNQQNRLSSTLTASILLYIIRMFT